MIHYFGILERNVIQMGSECRQNTQRLISVHETGDHAKRM